MWSICIIKTLTLEIIWPKNQITVNKWHLFISDSDKIIWFLANKTDFFSSKSQWRGEWEFLDFESCKALESLNKFERICPKVMANRQKTIQKHLVSRWLPRYIPIYCVCFFVHSYLWSSTSNRRKSGGWGSSSTRGTCASHSWSWRLRTWKTLNHRTHFETWATRKVTLTSSWEHMSHCKIKKTHFLNHHAVLGVLTHFLSFHEPTRCTGVSLNLHLMFSCLSLCQSH